MRQLRMVWLALLVAITACGGRDRSAVPKQPAGGTTETDNGLWAFAPADLEWGLVIPDGRLQPIIGYMRAGATELDTTWGSSVGDFVTQMYVYHGVDFKDAGQRKGAGFDPEGGFAVFSVPGDTVSVYSVPDVQTYRKRFKVVQKNTPSGLLDFDQEGAYCAAWNERYICSRDHQRIAAYRDGKIPGLDRPADMAGDLELFIPPGMLGPVNSVVTNPGGLHLAASFQPGAATVQALLSGDPHQMLPRRGGPSDLIDRIPAPSLRSAGYVDLRQPWRSLRPTIRDSWAGAALQDLDMEDFIDGLRGDIAVYSSIREDIPVVTVLVGFEKDRAMARLLRSCEELSDFNPVMRATRVDGVCRVSWDQLTESGFRWLDIKTDADTLILEFAQDAGVTLRSGAGPAMLGKMKDHDGPLFIWSAGLSTWLARLALAKSAELPTFMEQIGTVSLCQVTDLVVTASASSEGLRAEADITTLWALDDIETRRTTSRTLLDIARGDPEAIKRLQPPAAESGPLSEILAHHGVWAPHLALLMVGAFFYSAQQQHEPTDAMAAVVAFEQLSVQACQCSDDDCRAAILDEWDVWVAEHGETGVNDGQVRRIEDAADELRECLGIEAE